MTESRGNHHCGDQSEGGLRLERMRIVLLLSVISIVQAQDKPAERFQYFYEQRRFPRQQIPEGARLRALQTLDRIRAGKFTPRAAGTGGKWKLIGPQHIAYSSNGFITSGRITARGEFSGSNSIERL